MRATCSSRSEAAERAASSSAAAPFAERIVSDPQASVEGEAPPVQSFGDRVAAQVAARSSQLVLGLDPDPAKLWPKAVELADAAGGGDPLPTRAGRAVAAHCALAIEAAGGHCAAVKPQVACFERLGAPGWAALQETIDRGGSAGLIVIADGKRGDIDSPLGPTRSRSSAPRRPSSGRYRARRRRADRQPAARGRLAASRSSTPLASAAAACLCWPGPRTPAPPTSRSSRCSGGGIVSDRIAAMIAALGRPGIGTSGLSDIAAVVGATAPERLEALRELMPATRLPAARGGRPGRPGAGSCGRVRSGPRGWAGLGLAGDRRRPPRNGGDPAARRADEAARLRELAWHGRL